MYTPINSWSQDDRPREKLLHKGKNILSNAELLAILIGSGSKNENAVELCRKILSFTQNNLSKLSQLSVQQLQQFKGIGQAKAISIIAALELGKRKQLEATQSLSSISSSKDVFNIMAPFLTDLPHEEFWVIYLNNANKVVYKSQISKGGLTQTSVDSRIIFKQALEHHSTAIVLCHNHPSGKLQPSQTDINITQKIKTIGKHLTISVLDHLIITQKNYYSFADNNLL